MATKSQVPSIPAVEPTFGERFGIGFRETIDAEPSVVRGYRAASDPTLVQARKAVNAARTTALTAKLLADLSV